jgi:hypothetical protein
MPDPKSQPFRPPESDSLPPAGTSLEGMIRFISTFELPLIRQFRDRWGEQYKQRVQAHWSVCIRRFQSGTAAEGPADELLLCLAYDCILGPYLARCSRATQARVLGVARGRPPPSSASATGCK